ncbi:hypothetical protein PIB30_039371 [Stylosanthes scabra]|uniref:Uncharacterized protein n=1 Tax=Stylosanthes scabra TaxID=79078 RepID=A0ABU6XCR7_9FABA|nr:hypothetical protein [Stylosanthes scabra]
MIKRGKKIVQTPPTKTSTRLAALKAPVSPISPPASLSTPAIPQSVAKKLIFIDLTKNSESEKGSKEEDLEKKLTSEEDDVHGDDPQFWEYDDLPDWQVAEQSDNSEASCTGHPPPTL